jgi:hypothetical protein
MTKIKMAVSAAIVAAAGLIGSQAAFAVADPATQNPGSDLFAVVWDSATSKSYVVDLGTAWASLHDTTTFQSSGGFTTSWTLDTSATQLSTDLGGSADNFSVFAESYVSPNTFMFGLNGSTAPTITTTQLTSNVMASARNYLINNMTGTTTSLVGSGTTYWASCSSPINPGCNGGSYNLTAMNNLGSATPGTGSLNFYKYVADARTRNPAHGSFVGNSAGAGVFTLNGNVLTYTLAAASQVPLPAAGWLLISGLLGLGAVGRRRDAAVAV